MKRSFYVYENVHVIVMQIIIRLEITKLYIESVMLWSWLHVILIKSKK